MYQVNFLPWRHENIKNKKRNLIIITIIFSLLALILCCYLTHHQNRVVTHLKTIQFHQQAQLQQIQQLKSQLLGKQKQIDKLTTQKNRLNKYSQSNHDLLALLQTLPLMTPPKSWLNSVKLLNNHLEITAKSYHFQDISRFPDQLERSHLLNNIQLKKLIRVKNLNYLHLSATHRREAYE
ncbi:PilN domain-containing protein [Providencia sp. Je.9.19]|uniref:PilN domain-containing protein n=1 Tax=Providencia sp. Je.9.19 TaxID=3142844 RepID=UPI003DA937D4